jgi:hypothetical protein
MDRLENFITIESLDHLRDTLGDYNVPIDTWGVNNTKTVFDLYEEIRHGEAGLFLGKSGVEKYLSSVKVDVYYTHPADGRLERLVEKVQHNKATGSWRHRALHNSLSEKRRGIFGEGPAAAAIRALAEEIQVSDPFALNLNAHKIHGPKMEMHYGGLLTTTETHYYVAQLAMAEYNPRGYVEDQPHQTTYFKWETVWRPKVPEV